MDEDLELIRALRLTADPPREWIEAASLIPSTLGALGNIEAVVNDPCFRERFTDDPAAALAAAGLPATAPFRAAVREMLA